MEEETLNRLAATILIELRDSGCSQSEAVTVIGWALAVVNQRWAEIKTSTGQPVKPGA